MAKSKVSGLNGKKTALEKLNKPSKSTPVPGNKGAMPGRELNRGGVVTYSKGSRLNEAAVQAAIQRVLAKS